MNVRKLAVEAIDKIFEKSAFSNIVVKECLDKFELSNEDKALFTNLVYGTVQKYITLNYFLEPFIEKKKPKHFIYNLLLMSVYQLVYLDIPEYAVLDESVKIAKIKDLKLGTFVNGVLRNFLRTPLRDIENIKDSGDLITYYSVKYSHPIWLVTFLLKDYNYEELEKILTENNSIKKDAIRVNTLKATKEEVINELRKLEIEFEDTGLVSNGLIVSKNVSDTILFKKGLITIQDLSSQKVSEVANPKKGDLVIDMCAAPGGKSAHLASIMENEGRIYSCDIYPQKIKLMNSLFTRLGTTICKSQQIDARIVKDHVRNESFDLVVCDVPCSGLGVMSHKVDLKYKINLDSINEIIALQKEIIEASYPLVKKGGALCYSTCTINKDENERIIKWFIKNHNDMIIEYEKQILPYEYKSDGFYICKLRRK